MNRAISPVSKKKVRTCIGRSNRRQMIHSSLFYDGAAYSRKSHSPDGQGSGGPDDFDATNMSLGPQLGTNEDGEPFYKAIPHVPRSTSALSGTIGGLNNTIHSGGDISWGWAAETMTFTGGRKGGLDATANRGRSQTPVDLVSAFRSTNCSSVSYSLSPTPGAARERLTANTRAMKAQQPPSSLTLLEELRRRKSGTPAQELIPAVAGGVDPRYVACPVEPSVILEPRSASRLADGVNRVTTAPSQGQLSGTLNSKPALPILRSPSPFQAPDKGMPLSQESIDVQAHHREGSQRRMSQWSLRPDGISKFLAAVPHVGERVDFQYTAPSHSPTRTGTAFRNTEASYAPSVTDRTLEAVDHGPAPKTRLGKTPRPDTRYITEPPSTCFGGTYLSPAAQFSSHTRGLEMSNLQQEERMARLAMSEIRVRRRQQSEQRAQDYARRLEQKDEERFIGSLERKAQQKRDHERAAKEESDRKPRFVRFTESLMRPTE